jgi:hypothetical protein
MNPRPTDDPHDVLVVAPDVAVMAPTDEELARLARSLRPAASPQPHTAADLPAGAAIPPVDTTFRPTATGDVRLPGRQRTMGAQAIRAIIVALLLAACAGAAKISWLSYGDAAEAMIAQWAPQRVLALLLPQEKPALPAQPAPVALEAAVVVPAAPAPGAVEGAAPAATTAAADPAPSLGAMTNDLASARQEIEQLKASIEQLKASQQQMSRDLAKASENKASEVKASENKASETRAPDAKATGPNLRPKLSAHQGQAPTAPSRRPMPPPPPRQAAAYPPPPAAAPYVPRQAEPQPPTTAETLTDPELTSVPRPPMPLR